MAEPNGLYYMRARYYDPETGRFISEDPIGFDGGDVNLYVYAGNNPVMGVDPLGLSEVQFNRSESTLTIYSQGKQVAQFPAGNNTTSTSNGPWPNGTYDYSYYLPHPESGSNGPYGSNGNFVFNVPGRTGMGIHSGRKGPQSKTEGCIRTTDEGTEFLRNQIFVPILFQFIVVSGGLIMFLEKRFENA
jgi:RHS repeat-associated protein